MKRWSILATGLGFGLFIGALSKSPVAVWIGVAISVAGMVAYVASLPSGEDIPLDATEPRRSRSGGEPDRPAVAGLGTRVDELLKLAQQQADDLLREQRAEAARIIERAEREAGRIRAAADGAVWVVWSQDDNGDQHEVARVPARGDADALAATMRTRGHQQTYWVAGP